MLDGRAPELAAFYPSMGGVSEGDPGPAFLRTVAHHRDEVSRHIDDGVQTNEVGRSAALVGGFAEVARTTGLPLRVLEVGASAGLNLRWDHFAYDTGRVVAGDPTSPVRFERVWEGDPPDLPATFEVVERIGCDRNPLDATTAEGRHTLMSYVWPDQLERFERLDAAIEVARRVPAHVERADAAELGGHAAGRCAHPAWPPWSSTRSCSSTCRTAARQRFRDAVASAGARASERAPVAWLRMEPGGDRAEIRLTTWPGGEERLLATAGYHGRPVWWNRRREPGGQTGVAGTGTGTGRVIARASA